MSFTRDDERDYDRKQEAIAEARERRSPADAMASVLMKTWAKDEAEIAKRDDEIAKLKARVGSLEDEIIKAWQLCMRCLRETPRDIGYLKASLHLANAITEISARAAVDRFDLETEIAKLRELLRALVEEIDDALLAAFFVGRSDCPQCMEDPAAPVIVCPYHAAKGAGGG